jgi:hypothetical protein
MSKPNPEWQRSTALRKINDRRSELTVQGVPFTELSLAKLGAKYVGADLSLVLRWMEQDSALRDHGDL